MELEILETTAIRIFNDGQDKRIFPPVLSEAIRQRYNFVEYPKSVQEFTNGAGITYGYGYFEDFVIGQLIAYNDAILVTAQEHSDRLNALTDDFILLVQETFGLDLDQSSARNMYLSKVEVHLKDGFSDWFEQLKPVIARMKEAALESGIDVSAYEVGGFSIAGESASELKPGRFVLERRANQPFNANLFYSEAPLSSDDHGRLLREIENMF